MLGTISFHILWTSRSSFSPCPYGIVVVVFHFDSGGRKKTGYQGARCTIQRRKYGISRLSSSRDRSYILTTHNVNISWGTKGKKTTFWTVIRCLNARSLKTTGKNGSSNDNDGELVHHVKLLVMIMMISMMMMMMMMLMGRNKNNSTENAKIMMIIFKKTQKRKHQHSNKAWQPLSLHKGRPMQPWPPSKSPFSAYHWSEMLTETVADPPPPVDSPPFSEAYLGSKFFLCLDKEQ